MAGVYDEAMDVNPYESPREFGYVSPIRRSGNGQFSWRRVLLAVAILVGGSVIFGVFGAYTVWTLKHGRTPSTLIPGVR